MADLPRTPNNRTEDYLAGIAGDSSKVPSKPWSRKEAYLQQILDNGGGGAGVNVVQTVGDSETDVMSQDATSRMAFTSTSDNKLYDIIHIDTSNLGKQVNTSDLDLVGQISIGRETTPRSSATGAISIGNFALSDWLSTALGFYASSEGSGVALGSLSKEPSGVSGDTHGTVSVGSDVQRTYVAGGSTHTVQPFTRRIVNVKDPVNAQDAATKGYVDGLVGDVESALDAINNGTGE